MKRLIALPLLAVSIATAQHRLEVTTNVPADFTWPMGETTVHRVLAKTIDGSWAPIPFEQKHKVLSFRIDPAVTGGKTHLLINPPDGIVLDDQKPPRLLELQVDGKEQPLDNSWEQLAGAVPPKVFCWVVADPESGVDGGSLRVSLDGTPLAQDRLESALRADGTLSLTVGLADLALGKHVLRATVTDRSPDRNALSVEARIDCFDPTNLLRSTPGIAKLAVDSHYTGYSDISPLTDGVRQLPGKSAGNDVTWASAEDTNPHWVDITLREPVTLKEITIYWARESSASRTIEIQIPKGDMWETIQRVESLPAKQGVEIAIPATKLQRFRVFQPSNGGSKERPGLMWITEIEAR